MQADRRDYGARRSLWWLFRIGCIPFLPGHVLQSLREIRAGLRREAQRRQVVADASDDAALARAACLQSPPATEKRHGRTTSAAQMLASPFLAHARDLEEGMAAESGIELRRPYLPPGSRRVRVRGTRVAEDAGSHRQVPAPAGDGADSLPERVRTRETKAEFVVTFRWQSLGAGGGISRGPQECGCQLGRRRSDREIACTDRSTRAGSTRPSGNSGRCSVVMRSSRDVNDRKDWRGPDDAHETWRRRPRETHGKR